MGAKMVELSNVLELFDTIMQYLVIPACMWIWLMHKNHNRLDREMAVMRAEAHAREESRTEERESTKRQLDQIIATLTTMSGRIDVLMRSPM